MHLHSSRHQMVVYQLAANGVEKVHSTDLRTTGAVSVHVVDNLLVIHDSDSKVFFFLALG